MAPIKRRPQTRSNHKKVRRRKPNISELVYKYLSLDDGKESGGNATDRRKCRFCKGQKRPAEVLNSPDSPSTKNMANKRKDSSRNSKLHRVKRRPTARDQTLSSCMDKSNGKEGIKKMKRYIQKALDFGVESGYLIPKDASYKVLHVSSDLMNDVNHEARKSGSPVSQARGKTVRQTPIRFEDYEVQDARRRRRRRGRKRRRRSRSGSRRRRRSSRRRRRSRRGRRRSGSGNADEIVEVERDEYEYNNQPEKRNATENANRGEENNRANRSDGEKTKDKREEDDGSDLSVDEDETDDDEEKKRDDTTKS